jgi:hypothetical protein
MPTSLHDYEETRIAIPIYLTVCLFICGVLGWGFYELMQPAHYTNPGVAAYKAPPNIGITSLAPSTSRHERALPSVPNDSYLKHTDDLTTGRAEQSPEPEPAVAPVPPPQIKSARKQENNKRAARATPQPRQVQHSAPIQSHPFGGFGAAYAGYAALH